MSPERIEQDGVQDYVTDNRFPVIGIGASAGGLEAFERFFTNLPSDSGMAYVVIQHLDPTHESMLHEILQRYTKMPVVQVTDQMPVERDHVYVIPPNRDMALENGKLILTEPARPRGYRLPIDFFFRSLAKDQAEKAIGIVLSGTASDGTLGVKAIKGEGGMAMAQQPDTARYAGMPENAIATGLIDFILPPEEMPNYLIAYVEQVFRSRAGIDFAAPSHSADALHEVFALLRTHSGHDFSYYKPHTISRRIERRIAVTRRRTLQDYVQYLKNNPFEIQTLFKEMLIGVTRFFRDSEAFDYLDQHVIPDLINRKQNGEPIRVWVAGCSTGEEAYSIAILLYEALLESKSSSEIQLFATDIDLEAIDKARTAVYSSNIVADVPPDILQRHFIKEKDHFRLKQHIRDIVVFADQSLIKDPPFSRLDLISCRNLLIYLDLELQKRVIQLFHYALNSGGCLVLGTSESLASFDHLFEVVDKKWKIYRRLDVDVPRTAINIGGGLGLRADISKAHMPPPTVSVQDLAQQAILARYPFPAVIVNEQGEILYFHGNTSDYLHPPTGEASFNLLSMVDEKLSPALRDGIRSVFTRRKEITQEVTRLPVNGTLRSVRISLQPISHPTISDHLALIVFEEVSEPEAKVALDDVFDDPLTDKDRRILELQQELRSAREYLQTTIEELETSNEELRAANEELQSTNEELQSTNEELETTKEELQSVNEELITVNAELNDKIKELRETNTHQRNLMDSMNSGLIFLNERLEIQLFNPIAGELLNLVDHDIGRPVHHFAANFNYMSFTDDCEHVLNTLKPISDEIQSTGARWYVMEIYPYRTLAGDVTGLVVTFVDVTEQKKMLNEIAREQHLYRTLVSHLPNAVALLFDHDLRYVVVEGQALETFDSLSSSVEGQNLKDAAQGSDRQEQLTDLYRATLKGESHIVELTQDDITFLVQTTPIYDEQEHIVYGLLTGVDISPRRKMEQELERNAEIYRTLAQHWPDKAIFVFDHDLRYIFAGGEALQAGGFIGEEMIGRTLFEMLVRERAEKYAPYYKAVFEGERVEFTSALGERRYHNLAIPIKRSDGTILAGMVISTEIVGNVPDQLE